MSYVLINHAPDGTHRRTFKTEARALKALADFLGRSADDWGNPLVIGKSYYGDWGNRLIVEERAAGHTVARERAISEAYDARETGTATKRQLALLERHGF